MSIIWPYLRPWRYIFSNAIEISRWLRAIVHRGLYGWDIRDTWSLDYYASKVLSESIDHLRAHKHGHPCWCEHPSLDECHCSEKWDRILSDISTGLREGVAWCDDMSLDENDVRKRHHKYAMQLLSEHWFGLWD